MKGSGAAESKDLNESAAAHVLPSADAAPILNQRFVRAYSLAAKTPWRRGGAWTTIFFRALWALHRTAILWQITLCFVEVAFTLVTPVLLRELLRWLQATVAPDQRSSGDGADPPVWKGWVLAVSLGLSSMAMPVMLHHHKWVGLRTSLRMRQEAVAAIHAKLLRLSLSAGAAAASDGSAAVGASSEMSAGYVSTLIGVDVRRLEDVAYYYPYIFSVPFQLAAVLIMVGLELDFVSAVAGLAICLALIPIQIWLADYISELRTVRARCTDNRVRLLAEAVEGHLAVKMCGLEDVYQARIKQLRRDEEAYVRRSSRIRALNIALFSSGSSIIAFVTFSVYRARSGALNVASVFYALSLLQLPSSYLVDKFALATQFVSELGVSITRIQAFLSLPELAPPPAHAAASPQPLKAWPLAPAADVGAPEPQPSLGDSGSSCSSSTGVGPGSSHAAAGVRCVASEDRGGGGGGGLVATHGGDFDWRWPLGGRQPGPQAPDATSMQQLAAAAGDDDAVVAFMEVREAKAAGQLCDGVSATLSGVRFSCAPGELLGVCGATGSGKSTLLAALLGQLQPLQQQHEEEGAGAAGGVQLRGSVAYCAQVPWIMAGCSVRDNITFGLPYEQEWYDAVVSACCLPEDLARMAAGDLTELGEGGAGLSGGQKARVALARACYCRPDVALLDDPLSAVDARVGLQLFERVLGPAGLMAVRCGTTRLLVTHQEQFLPLCDRVLLLRGGRQAALGPWSEVQQLRREPLALAPAADASAVAESAVSTPVAVGTAAADAAVDSSADEGTDSPTQALQPAGSAPAVDSGAASWQPRVQQRTASGPGPVAEGTAGERSSAASDDEAASDDIVRPLPRADSASSQQEARAQPRDDAQTPSVGGASSPGGSAGAPFPGGGEPCLQAPPPAAAAAAPGSASGSSAASTPVGWLVSPAALLLTDTDMDTGSIRGQQEPAPPEVACLQLRQAQQWPRQAVPSRLRAAASDGNIAFHYGTGAADDAADSATPAGSQVVRSSTASGIPSPAARGDHGPAAAGAALVSPGGAAAGTAGGRRAAKPLGRGMWLCRHTSIWPTVENAAVSSAPLPQHLARISEPGGGQGAARLAGSSSAVGPGLVSTPRGGGAASVPLAKLLTPRLLGRSVSSNGGGGRNSKGGGAQVGGGKAKMVSQWINSGNRLTMWGGAGGGGGKTSERGDGKALKRSTTGASLLASEDKETGAVSWSVYGRYVRCLGLGLAALVVLGLLAGEAAYLAADWWLALWAAAEPAQQAEPKWQWVYAILTAAVFALSISRFVLFFEAAVSAATGLHNTMLLRVLRSPLSFFHANPAGRITNRFSKDQGLVDDLLPGSFGEVLDSGTLVFGAVVLVAIAVPFMMPLFIPLVLAFMWVRKRYISGSREFRRWEAVTYSPIYSFVAATCKGLPTIRAYGAGERFQQELLQLLSRSAEWSYASNAGWCWLGIRTDSLSATTLLCAAVMAVGLRDRLRIEVLALALTHALNVTALMQFFVQQTAEVENHMTSVERMLVYTELDSEPPSVAEGGGHPPAGWPRTGALHFQDVSAAYQPGLPPVLRGVTFSVPAGSSCGVVGRTGSGKSSLLLTLFRMVELTHGSILLDGVDIAAVGLDALRRHLAVIPQDPVLFGGSLRSNLDPWGAHSSNDAELWAVLRSVRLAGAVSALPGGLDAQVAAGGANLSAGQRQLLCLARAMLQRAKVLALDEATANVDAETDEAVQTALRDFLQGGSTGSPGGASGDGGATGGGGVALVIAHRLDTVMDLDALLVLAEGRVEEWGPPRQLLRGDGSLSHMAAAAAEAPRVGNGRTEVEAVVTQGAQGAGRMVRSMSDAGWRA
ncbi:hypothetical protein HXX76_009829 [Chlamydomonas incerta]|uniref:Uncharacterized protein n=1 Tax=Chlamydomonas incerta TaxID=51695 RepID=A0A835VWW0_CHLIN|nr:hypothetical protein HXX76_009829 [Chlamydomonas incerta]|eukprot:KAG2430855.1 hypothetical protein HXX76_009829 [Chlamydomonas incerta]